MGKHRNEKIIIDHYDKTFGDTIAEALDYLGSERLCLYRIHLQQVELAEISGDGKKDALSKLALVEDRLKDFRVGEHCEPSVPLSEVKKPKPKRKPRQKQKKKK